MSPRLFALLFAGLCIALPASAKLQFQFDYSLDANGFFNPATPNGQAARAALERAGHAWTDRFIDTFSGMSNLSPNDRWFARVHDPASNTLSDVYDLTIAPNVIKVYAGGCELDGNVAAQAGFGSFGFTADRGTPGWLPWVQSLFSRGETGALAGTPTDVARWGGTIQTDLSMPFHFGLTTSGLDPNEVDFLTVATHELGHLLGFLQLAQTNSFTRLIVNNQYTGPAATGANGGVSPTIAASHLSGATSTVGGQPQAPVMDASVNLGQRKRLTVLDFAVFDDMGYALELPAPNN